MKDDKADAELAITAPFIHQTNIFASFQRREIPPSQINFKRNDSQRRKVQVLQMCRGHNKGRQDWFFLIWFQPSSQTIRGIVKN